MEENRGLGLQPERFSTDMLMKILPTEALSQNSYLTLLVSLAKSVIRLMKLWNLVYWKVSLPTEGVGTR